MCYRGHPAQRDDYQLAYPTKSQSASKPSPYACSELETHASTKAHTAAATRTYHSAGLGYPVQGEWTHHGTHACHAQRQVPTRVS